MPFVRMIKLKLKMQNKITKKYQFYLSFILDFFKEKKDFMTQKHFNSKRKGEEERKIRKKEKEKDRDKIG